MNGNTFKPGRVPILCATIVGRDRLTADTRLLNMVRLNCAAFNLVREDIPIMSERELIPVEPVTRIEQMVDLNKWRGFYDSLDGAVQLQDAIHMERNREGFVGEAALHRHGTIFRLSVYANHYPEPQVSLAMSEADLKTLAGLLNAALVEGGQ